MTHRKRNVNVVALLGLIAGVVILGSVVAPRAPQEVVAAGDLTGVSCSDIYVDLPPAQVKGAGPGPEDLAFPANPVGKSITRTEPSKNTPTAWRVTTVNYMGPGTFPNAPPTIDPCANKISAGKLGPEANQMNPDVKLQAFDNKRPTTDSATIEVKPGGSFLRFSTCEFSETLKQWVRMDVNEGVGDKSAQATNNGTLTLYLGTGSPADPNDPLTCDPAAVPETQCSDSLDNDGDGLVNDGCPAVSTSPPESGTQCANVTDDDKDGTVNDGCPRVKGGLGPDGESGTQCGKDVVDDDNDNSVNDGCPVEGGTWPDHGFDPTECGGQMDAPDEDPIQAGPQDEDNAVNDGCPAATQAGTVASDAEGDPTPAEAGYCQNATDDDKDGAVNDGCPSITTDPTPEESGAQCSGAIDDDTDGAVNDGCPPIGGATQIPFVVVSHKRVATTDEPANIGASVIADPDGVAGSPPPVPQPPDGDSLPDDWDGDGCTDWDELAAPAKVGSDPFNPADCDRNYTGTYNLLATISPVAKQGRITGPKVDVNSTSNKVIKDGKHIEADLTVSNPSALRENQKVYWDTDDADQAGWWQVRSNPSAGNPVSVARLFAPPCGLNTVDLPSVPEPTPGRLMGVVCDGPVQAGAYVHCIVRVDHDKLANTVDGQLQCYIDVPAPGNYSSPLKPAADGSAGPPPPPPYTTAAPAELTGTFNKVDDQLILRACFGNVGLPWGPNFIIESHIDGSSLKGFTKIWPTQGIDECDAITPQGYTTPVDADTVLAAQDIAFDHDDDGCSDYNELGHGESPPPPKLCGDDPYNPLDSDQNFNSVGNLLITLVPADVCNSGLPAGCTGAPDGLILAGLYVECAGAADHHDKTGSLQSVTVRMLCVIDYPYLTVNCQDAASSAANPCTNAITCFAAHPSSCGDGLPGAPPPRNDPDGAGPATIAYSDVDNRHTQFTASYVAQANVFQPIVGCYENLENPYIGPSVFFLSFVDAHTGQGVVDIFLTQPVDCDPSPGGSPPAPYNDALIEVVEQATKNGPMPPPEMPAKCYDAIDDDGDLIVNDGCPPSDYDTDHDGCSDTQELRDATSPGLQVAPQQRGGLRDPLNRWDLMSVYNGNPLIKDRAVGAADLAALVSRFGANDTGPGDFNRNSDPNLLPNLPVAPSGSRANYHPQFDRGGTLVGSNPWNLKPPNGNIGGAEIANAIAQYGHNCNV